MTDPVSNLLGAYVDGELNGKRLQQVEAHLASCAGCREELNNLKNLSAALKEAELPGELPMPEHFTARVMLSLPRQPQPSYSQRELPKINLAAGLWLAPTAILVVWIFIQTVLVTSWAVIGADSAGLLGNLPSYLASNPVAGWFSNGIDLLDGRLSETSRDFIQVLREGEQLGWQFFVPFILQAILVFLFWSTMAGWWIIRQQQKSE